MTRHGKARHRHEQKAKERQVESDVRNKGLRDSPNMQEAMSAKAHAYTTELLKRGQSESVETRKRVIMLHPADTEMHQAAVSGERPASSMAKGTIIRKLR